MKLPASIVLILSSQCIYAADFRTLNFGDSCSNVERKELELGSVKISKNKPIFKGNFVYNGLGLEGNALISYECGENNLFKSGFIYYRFYEFENAENFLTIAANLITDVHGSPGEMLVLGTTENNFHITFSWSLKNTTIVVGSNTLRNIYGVGLEFSQAVE